MNIELLEKVKAHILEEPKRLMMPLIITRKSPFKDDSPSTWNGRYPSCGTMGCFAGWACVLAGIEVSAVKAAEVLKLDVEQASSLFYGIPENWARDDQLKLWSGDGTPETAALAARRIDEFIASDGAI